MIRLIAAVSMLVFLTGCAAWTPVKFAADRVCDSTPERQALLASEFDEATHPHQIRVHCDVQEDE